MRISQPFRLLLGSITIIFFYSVSASEMETEIIDNCYGTYWATDKACSSYLSARCDSDSYDHMYLCASAVEGSGLKDMYPKVLANLKKMKQSESLCDPLREYRTP